MTQVIAEARFAPGGHVAMVVGAVRGLVAASADSPLVAELWEEAHRNDSLDAVIDVLLRQGDHLPDLGFVELGRGSVRLVARGDVAMELVAPDGITRTIRAPGVRSWLESVEHDVGTVLIHHEDWRGEPTLSYAATHGVVPAAALVTAVDTGSIPPPPPAPGGMVPAPTHAPEPSVAAVSEAAPPVGDAATPPALLEAGSDDEADDLPGPDGHADIGPLDTTGEQSADADADADADTMIGPFDEEAAPDVDRAAAVPPSTDMTIAPSAELTGGYDFLFGETRARTVEEAAVRDEADAESAPEPSMAPASDHSATGLGGLPGGAPVITAVPGGPTAGPTASPAVPPPPSQAASGGASAPGAPMPSTPLPGPPAPGAGNHDGHTISLAKVREMSGSSGTPTPPPRLDRPTVQTVSCASGHLNPPHAGVCRVCGGAVADQEPREAPLPPLGQLRLPDGRTVPLDRSLVLGRSPRVDHVDTDGELPLPVVIESPKKEVSSTHAEIHADQWQIVVVDRRSTNGTVIRIPGRPAQLLRPGERTNVPVGTVVTLGDEVSVVIEALP